MSTDFPVRITVRDSDQTISFVRASDSMHRLIAACSAEPTTVAEILTAADIYEQGIAVDIMAELMKFDLTVLREGLEPIHHALEQAAAAGEPFHLTFQVMDRATERAAFQPAGSRLVLIDLHEQRIQWTPSLRIERAGEIYLRTKAGVSDRKVTYILPQSWEIGALDPNE